MKKRILVLSMVLALVAALMTPMTVSAGALSGASDALSNYTASFATPTHTIAFTTAVQIPIAGTITITFPAEMDIALITNADVTETVQGAGAIVTWARALQVLTGTVSVGAVTVGAQSLVIGDGAPGNLNDIANPSVAGTYTITILTSVDTVASMVVNITTSGTTTVTGNLPNVIAVSAPAGFAMPSLDPSVGQPITSSGHDVLVSATGLVTTTWKLQAAEASGDGKMTCSSPGAGTLAAVMVLNATDGAGDVSLSGAGTPVTLYAAHPANIGQAHPVPVAFKQTVAYTDIVGSNYSIIVTFTVGFNV